MGEREGKEKGERERGRKIGADGEREETGRKRGGETMHLPL